MKKIVSLTEVQLKDIINRVVSEQLKDVVSSVASQKISIVQCASLGIKSKGYCDTMGKKPVMSCAEMGIKTPGFCYVDTKEPVPGIKKSTNSEKKLMAVFEKNGRQKIVHFGANGMSDYTKHKDPQRKARYIQRHSKNENWNDPTTPGALSRWILWNKPSLKDSIISYKKRFHL